ncbi:lysylphosphatidylglycerol synthase transmembrane domain-containing protein [Rheinheimera sp.]|uniref:lysylphosphatidylglycerol synthase transmembrane domain-containing protein n=1 Tax=Rheinheimera sp. TaxID=1869214 RepID=UPI00307EE679
MGKTVGFALQGKLKHLLGFGITLLCLFVLYRQVNIADVIQAFEGFNSLYLIAGAVSLAFGYAMRVLRWSLMLKSAGAGLRYSQCIAPFLGSIALNNVLPLRLGDVVRALVFPASMGITKATATSSLVIERLVDLVTLVFCLMIGLGVIQSFQIPPNYQTLAMTLVSLGSGLLLAGILFSGSLSHWLLHWSAQANLSETKTKLCKAFAEFFSGLNQMSRPGMLTAVLVLSMLIWAGEAGLFYFILLGFGIDVSPAAALLIMALATLSTLVPSSPGYVGPFHLAAYTAVLMTGVSNAEAASYAIVVHLALWLLTTVAGLVALLARPELFTAAKLQSVQN